VFLPGRQPRLPHGRRPKKVSSAEYLLFTQATPGGPWKNAIEPYTLSGASVPQPAVGADGSATAVTATTSALAAAPGQLPALTVASLNGSGPVTGPGNLAESADQRFWQAKLPTATVAGTHALAAGDEGETFALRTTSGGALVFYTAAATVTITPPAGSALRLTVPGLYSAALSLPSASLSYLDQFAAYDPPAGGGTPSIVADYSGSTGQAQSRLACLLPSLRDTVRVGLSAGSVVLTPRRAGGAL
jgi:hypothetical protein